MKTCTHYINTHGQHYLPAILQDREIETGDVIADADQLSDMGEPEYHEILDALRSLGAECDKNSEGDLIASVSMVSRVYSSTVDS